MDQVIRRLETIHRALRAAPESSRHNARIAEAVADCLRELHAIVAQSADDAQDARSRLRLIDRAAPPLH